MPPGYYHMQHTKDASSLHYTLTLDPLSFWGLLNSSLNLELLKNCSTFNEDIRCLDGEERKKFLDSQLRIFKKEINLLTAEHIEKLSSD